MTMKRDKAGLLAMLFTVAMFFAASAIFMALWNSVVMDSLGTGIINKISYLQATGLTLFVVTFIQAPRVVYDLSRIVHDPQMWK